MVSRFMPRARLSRRAPIVALAVALSLSAGGRAHALDATRTLTQYVHRIWQTQQGLPQASIYAIAQTVDGRLWLGTRTGLVHFDGVRFASFDGANGVSLSHV